MSTVLILRTCKSDGSSRDGFVYPECGGTVAAPDWEPTMCCGHGLHGLLWGVGNASHLSSGANVRWLVIRAHEGDVLTGEGELIDKCKFKCGTVVYNSTDRDGAISYLCTNGAADKHVVFKRMQGGYGSILTGGDWSTLTGGDWSILTGGYRSTLTGDDWSTLTGGYGSTLTGGDWSILTGGYRSILTGGNGSTLTITQWDGRYYRLYTVYVGENGILPNVPYILNDQNMFVLA